MKRRGFFFEPMKYIRNNATRILVQYIKGSLEHPCDAAKYEFAVRALLESISERDIPNIMHNCGVLAYVLDEDATSPFSVLGETMRRCRDYMLETKSYVPTVNEQLQYIQSFYVDLVARGMGRVPSPYDIF